MDLVVREGAVRMDIVDCVEQFNFKGDRFTGQCLHEDLHTTMEMEGTVKCRLLLDVAVREGAVRTDIVNHVEQFAFEGNGFTG